MDTNDEITDTDEEETRPITVVATLESLNKDERFRLMELFARGYTARTIGKLMLKDFQVMISDQILLQGAVLYADDIEEYRKELGKVAINTGLARKEERVRRLGELAESWEESAQSSTKAAGVYLKTLGQIQEETEPLGLVVPVDKDDPWKQLLQQIASSQRTSETSLPSDQTNPRLEISSPNAESQESLKNNGPSSPVTEGSS